MVFAWFVLSLSLAGSLLLAIMLPRRVARSDPFRRRLTR
jgi:hypothetical protein